MWQGGGSLPLPPGCFRPALACSRAVRARQLPACCWPYRRDATSWFLVVGLPACLHNLARPSPRKGRAAGWGWGLGRGGAMVTGREGTSAACHHPNQAPCVLTRHLALNGLDPHVYVLHGGAHYVGNATRHAWRWLQVPAAAYTRMYPPLNTYLACTLLQHVPAHAVLPARSPPLSQSIRAFPVPAPLSPSPPPPAVSVPCCWQPETQSTWAAACGPGGGCLAAAISAAPFGRAPPQSFRMHRSEQLQLVP